MNLTVPGAVAALESAFSELLRGSPPGFESFEASAKRIADACCAEAMGRALEARDRELASSRPAGSRSHSRRRRTLATLSGDVSFTRAVLLDAAGSTLYPLDEELGLPLGDRVSPAARAFLVTCGADVPFARTARLMAMAGGSEVSGVTVMNSLRGAGAAIAVGQRESARALFEDGVPPEAEGSAEHVLIEADGTHVRMRDGSTAEVKAAVAYAGKRPDGSRADPVRIGCVGELPGDFWEQAVAQVGRRFDLARAERVSLGADGEAQYVNGASRIPLREVDGWIDPFHVIRAAASCAVDRGAGGPRDRGRAAPLGPRGGRGADRGDGRARRVPGGGAGRGRLPAPPRGPDRGRAVDGHDGGRAAARLQGPHGVVPVRLVARGGRRDGEGAQLAALRLRPAAQDEGGVPLRGEGGAQGREAREARVLAARKPRAI